MPIQLPEIPEDAPFDPEQREWLKQYLSEFAAVVVASGVGGDVVPAASAAVTAATKGRVLIMVGSQSGNAESLAEGFAERLRADEYAVEVLDMEDFEKVDLRREGMVLIITSTWGEGDPPDNAEAFWNHFSSDAQMPLKKTRFSVLALGDTSYADFCEMGIRFDARFEELGAERIATRIDCDVDYEDMAEEWFRVVRAALDDIQLAPVSIEAAGLAATSEAPEVLSGFSKKNPFPARLLKGYALNKAGSIKDTRHFEFSLEGSELQYEVGDVLGVVPRNSPDLVDELLVLLPFNTTVKVDTHDGRKMTLRDALIECYDLRTLNKRILKNWRDKAGSPYLRSIVDADSEAHIAELIDGREIIDLVLEFPADFKGAQEFVDGLRKLNPRLYSIASSPKAHPGEVHLTVAKVEYRTHGRKRQGVCSCYLADRVAEGESVGVFVQGAKHFKLPVKSDVPIIMVGPGTGVAPFRAFLEERQATGATGGNWLFFGNPHEASDFFYQEEFEAMQEAGVLNRLEVAWSRDQDHKIYVQDKIRENSAEIWQWIKGGAHFYVCGDAVYMAGDVDKALHDLIEEHGGLSETEAAEYVARMKKSKRYQRDVY